MGDGKFSKKLNATKLIDLNVTNLSSKNLFHKRAIFSKIPKVVCDIRFIESLAERYDKFVYYCNYNLNLNLQ